MQGQNPIQPAQPNPDEWHYEDYGALLLIFLAGFMGSYTITQQYRPYLGKNDDRPCGISLIIPTKGEGKRIGYLLESIRCQTYTSYEVIVVDAYSNDGTREICEKYDVKFIEEEGYQAHAQNVGARAAKYRHLLFMDADAIMPDKDWLYNVMLYIHQNGIIHSNFHTKVYCDDKLPDITYDPFMAEIGYPIQKFNITFNIIDYCYCVYIDSDVFFGSGGFDDKLVIAQGSAFIDKCPFKPTVMPVELFIYTSDRRFRTKGMFQTVIELIKGNLCSKLGLPISTNYWEPSIGLDLVGQHLRAKDSGLHAVIKGNDVLIHMDQVPAHKDPIGHITKDVLKI